MTGNRLEGTSSFQYEGETYHLTLNNRVLLSAEDVLGYSALDAAEEAKRAMAVGRNPRLRTVIALFYGALVQRHPQVSEDDAINMFLGETREPQEAFKKVLRGTDAPLGNGPAADPEPAASPKKKPAGTGKKSSRSGAKRDSRRKNSG